MKIKNKFGRKSITQYWTRNIIGFIAIFLIVIEVLIVAVAKDYYYSSLKQYMTSKMNVVINQLSQSVDRFETNSSYEIRSAVENYSGKDEIELMAITKDGKIDITSSGFLPSKDIDMTDYEMAKTSVNDMESSVFRLPTGEKVMAETCVLSMGNSEYDGLRMIVSLRKVDRLIMFMTIIVTIIVLAILILLFFMGKVFIRSIVYPTIQIGNVARKIAKGDFSQRVKKTRDDELGDLCDSINYMAEELGNTEQMKNEFISSVSHELRTPLTAIKGWAETLMSMPEDRETFDTGMRVITSETERLSQMVEELLDFSRIQDNRLVLQMDTIDILAELTETVIIYQQRARALGITLNYYEPIMLPFVYGDKNRLRQVFINVVDNAIKYSDKGDTVSVEAYEQNNEICISVSDTGIGISKDDLPKVKSKFFKANQTRRGSGIGLAVADEIITRHGGTLTINSEEGVGTTVMITLPCIKSKKEESEQATVNVELISSDSMEERNNLNGKE